MKTSTMARFHKLIWVLVFAGMLLLGLGLSVQRTDGTLGFGIIVAGAVMGIVGIVLLVVRSRLRDPE